SMRVQSLGRGLAPCFLRVGGTAADCMNFVPPKQPSPVPYYRDMCANNPKHIPVFNMTVAQWDSINKFVQKVGFDFIMDLNVLHRDANDSWSMENTRQLLDYSAARNYSIAGFELGNEYDLFHHAFNYNLSGSRLAQDYKTLKSFLGNYPQYASAILLGPETAHPGEDYFKAFLSAGGADTVDASTFHQYYFPGNKSSLDNFTDVRIMDGFRNVLSSGLNQSRSVKPSLRSWVSETSSSYGGGTPGVSDRFVAGFLWLDKLGLCAAMGIETVLRQDFYGGRYGLIDMDLNPNPDYWLTLLYKRIVRGAVFAVTGGNPMRLYAACADPARFGTGSLAVYYLNPSNSSQTLELPQFRGNKFLDLYLLTPGDADGLTSKFTALNGKKIVMNGDVLPELPTVTTNSSSVVIPPYSFGFVVAPFAQVPLCRLH
ncbi:hypothetical protein BaRGS_00022990, partial [Batillaria attramentaria]